MILRRTAAVFALLSLARCAGPASDACSIEHLATLRTVPALGSLAVPVTIGGEPAVMVLDTGAQRSMLTSDWFATQGRRFDRDTHDHTDLLDASGGSERVDNVIVPQLGFGTSGTGQVSLPLGKLPGLTDLTPPLAGLLGLDTLAPYDIDIDRPRGTVDLYLRSGCEGAAPPWPGRSTRVALLTANDNLLLLPVDINGRSLLAIVDTGARRSLLSATAGRRLGLSDAATNGDIAGTAEGVDRRRFAIHLHRFAQVRIGDDVFSDVPLAVSSGDFAVGDMLLGEDFFRTHRVWLSPSTATAFIASESGGAMGVRNATRAPTE